MLRGRDKRIQFMAESRATINKLLYWSLSNDHDNWCIMLLCSIAEKCITKLLLFLCREECLTCWNLFSNILNCYFIVIGMWHHLQRPALLRDKYCRPWSDAVRNALRLIRAYNICGWWTSTANFFVTPCAPSTINVIITNVSKQLI